MSDSSPSHRNLSVLRWDEITSAFGFPLCGITKPNIRDHSSNAFHNWLDQNFDADMFWIKKRKKERLNPEIYLEGVKSVLIVGLPYSKEPSGKDISMASYSNGQDYHEIMKKKLWEIVSSLKEEFGDHHLFRVCVDTSPVLEREFASQTKLGWQGKNTLVINQKLGSYFFIGEILTTIQSLDYESPHPDRCGTCDACLKACPANAFEKPYVLNSNKCISYQTIENRNLPNQKIDYKKWIYGCDICQQVCPWNNKETNHETELYNTKPQWFGISLSEILQLKDEAFHSLFRKTVIKRIKRSGLIKNALMVWKQNPHLAPIELIINLTDDKSQEIAQYAKDALKESQE